MDPAGNIENASQTSSKFKKVFIKNIGPNLNVPQLYKHFIQFGSISKAFISRNTRGPSGRHGFIIFETPDSAKLAIETMNGTLLDGNTLYVDQYLTSFERQRREAHSVFSSDCKLFVANLHTSIDDEELKNIFETFGSVEEAKVVTDHVTKVSKRYGHIIFTTPEAAAQAITRLNGHEYKNYKLHVSSFIPYQVRQEMLKGKQSSSTSHSYANPEALSSTVPVVLNQTVLPEQPVNPWRIDDIPRKYTSISSASSSNPDVFNMSILRNELQSTESPVLECKHNADFELKNDPPKRKRHLSLAAKFDNPLNFDFTPDSSKTVCFLKKE